MTDTVAEVETTAAGARRRGFPAWSVAVFAIALAVRVAFVLKIPGGISGNVNDDSAAYYAGATALVHGRLPYADFILLHPPLTDLLLTPFAALGAFVGDHVGFMSAIVFAQLVGAANAVLVVRVARRWGVGTTGAVLGGLFYAVWSGTASGESTISLESFGNTAFLLGLLALAGPLSRRSTLLGGLALGAAATAKLTWAVPPVIVAAWWLADRRTRRTTPWLVAGMVAAPVVICGVFFVAAPRAMVRMIVVDQLNRPPSGSVARHMSLLSDVHNSLPGSSHATAVVVWVLMATLGILVLALAARLPAGRMVVVIALVQFVILIESPSFFGHYAIQLGPALALSVAAAATKGARLGTVVSVLIVALVASLTTARLVNQQYATPPFPRAALTTLLAGTRCPTPDAPIVLIQTDTLSSTLADGCPNWIDVTGRIYDVDRPKPGGNPSRRGNKKWQRSLNTYLFSGDLVIVMRPKLGIGVRLQRRLDQLPLLLDEGGVKVYRNNMSR